MAGLFFVFIVALVLIIWNKRKAAFAVLVLNLVFCLFFLLDHMTNIVKLVW